MKLFDKEFDELELIELFNILRLRSEVFTEEQKITCTDPDNDDLISHHVFAMDDQKLVAYARYFIEDDKVLIGRVVVAKDYRGRGLSKILIRKVLEGIKENYPDKEINLHAQVYIKSLYADFGFEESGEVFDEAGVEHIMMKHQPLYNL